MVNLGSLLPEVSPEQAHRFLHLWFGGRDGYVVLTRISSAGQHIVQSWGLEVNSLLASPMSRDHLGGLCADTGGNWNVYISCSTHREDPTGGQMKRRGGKQTIDQVHGVWLDLDVKNEAFSRGAEQIDSFIRALEINPTMVVDSGSGGRHVYWRFIDPVDREQGELLCGEGAGQVNLIYDQGLRVDKEWLLHVANAAWQRRLEEIRQTKERVERDAGLARAALSSMHSGSDGGWGDLVTLAGVEDVFNESVTWDEILIPGGWRYVGTDYEGRRHWARPGQNAKSAHTDYPPSPHVMNLFSNAPETGLSTLHAAGVVLSKMIVYAQLRYGGDIKRLIEAFISGEFKGAAPAVTTPRTWQESVR
jgi:hypothetical protein